MPFDEKYRNIIAEFVESAKGLNGKLNDPDALRQGIKMLQDIEQRAVTDGDMPDLVTWTRNKQQRALLLLKKVEKEKKPYRK